MSSGKSIKGKKGLLTANLLDFEKWIEIQGDVHDDFGARASKQATIRLIWQLQSKTWQCRSCLQYGSTTCCGSPPPWRTSASGQSTLVPRVKEDGKYHKLHSCLKFKALSVQERLQKAKERGLYFRCFGRQWLSRCRSTKLCGVNGCTRLHHEQLHSLKFQSATTPQAFHLPENHPAIQFFGAFTVTSSNVMQASDKSRVLLQVVPVSLYGLMVTSTQKAF